jgi:predicted signal transduction protein with EAL and GGDEF domain
MTEQRTLAIAAAYGRVAYVFLIGGILKDWRVSDKASHTATEAAGMAQTWINDLRPDVVVTERDLGDMKTRKGSRTRALVRAIANTAAYNELLDVKVTRTRHHKNKVEEAEALARLYPDLAPYVPHRRRPWDKEPRNIVLFEALALAEELKRGGPTAHAAALG